MNPFIDKLNNFYSENYIYKNNYQYKKKLFILLSHELKKNFEISLSGKKRCKKLAYEIGNLDQDEFFVIFMGRGRKDLMGGSNITISEHMYNYFSKNYFKVKYFVLEKNSLDTVGDAVFSYLIQKEIFFKGSTTIITSDWHTKRVKCIFNKIYNYDRKLCFSSTNEMDDFSQSQIDKIMLKEKLSKNEFNKSFSTYVESSTNAHDFLMKNHNLYKIN